MTVSNDERIVTYTGNGVTTSFSVPFQFFELIVYVNAVEADPSDYSIVQVSPGLSGSVSFNVAPAGGAKIVIASDTSLVQSTDYVENDPFPAETHERALDRLTMAVLDTQRDTSTLAGIRHIVDEGKLTTYNATGQIVPFEPAGTGYVLVDADGVAQLVDDGPVTRAETAADAAEASQTAAASSASAAATSASAASSSATAASNSASAAASSATAAAGSATSASGSATAASGSATSASGSATAAAGSATSASNSATAAAASATAAASSASTAGSYASSAATILAGYTGTSASSVAVGTGSKTFTTQSGKQWTVGQTVIIASSAYPDRYMFGQVTSYSSTTLVVNVTAIGNAGTQADWIISLSGAQGPTGPSGSTTTTDPIDVVVYKDSGNVALGGYPATRRNTASRTLTKVYGEVFVGTGSVEFAVTRNGSVLASGTAAAGVPYEATISVALSVGDPISFEILNVIGTVTGLYAQVV